MLLIKMLWCMFWILFLFSLVLKSALVRILNPIFLNEIYLLFLSINVKKITAANGSSSRNFRHFPSSQTLYVSGRICFPCNTSNLYAYFQYRYLNNAAVLEITTEMLASPKAPLINLTESRCYFSKNGFRWQKKTSTEGNQRRKTW